MTRWLAPRLLGIVASLSMVALALAVALAGVAGAADATRPPDEERFVELSAEAATIHGATARFLVLEGIGNICYWTDPADWVSWDFTAHEPGEHVVVLKYSCEPGSQGSTFEVTAGDSRLEGAIADDTGSWYDHATLKVGTITVGRAGGGGEAGAQHLALKPIRKPGQAVMNLAWVRLIPAARYAAYEARRKGREPARKTEFKGAVHVVPNFHPASCGWLTDFSTERNYCAYSYLAHLDRVRDDPAYCFALSEVNNIMAILEFEPDRLGELRQRIAERRVELANAFFLEPTINLSGGEALVKMGAEGIRWQQKVLGFRPRLAWMIDVTGVHEQMGQIVTGLGLDGMVYTRSNPTRSTLHWFESPDGTRALGICPGHYSEWSSVFSAIDPLGDEALKQLLADVRAKARRTPPGTPVLVLGGAGDYALPPTRKEYPSEFIRQWKAVAPDVDVRFTGPGKFLDAVLPAIGSGEVELPVVRSGAQLTWASFWIQNPRVKSWYRRAEQGLQAAEALAAAASLRSGFEYPVQPLYHAWLQLLLNMDRNTLWGAAGGMVFEHPRSWDVSDRFESVEAISAKTQVGALRSTLGAGEAVGLFNPLNWKRTDPFAVKLPEGARLAGAACQALPDGRTLCRVDLPPLAAVGLEVEPGAKSPAESDGGGPAPAAKTGAAAASRRVVETSHYEAIIDLASGCLRALKLKPSGRMILGGPACVVAEEGQDGHETRPRPQRRRLGDSSQHPTGVTITEGPLATLVEARSDLHGGGTCRQTIIFHRDHPRIDFETELTDIPNATVVTAEFPLADGVREVRRGIPYGFSHGLWGDAEAGPQGGSRPQGLNQGILAAVRWTHYQLAGGGGAAILDRGVPGRELSGRTALIFLLNAQDAYLGYPCAWLSGKGTHRASFALVAHDGDWKDAGIPRLAWEFSSPPIAVEGVAKGTTASFAETSDNVIIEALRREGDHIEVRMAECLGLPGEAWIALELSHGDAAVTDLIGERARPLAATPSTLLPPSGGARYALSVRPQQIVTLRFRSERPVPAIEPLLAWDPLVPPAKLAALKRRLPNVKGHPPMGPGLQGGGFPTLPPDAAASLTIGKEATASNVYQGMEAHAARMAVDGSETTRWATDGTVREATLDVDLGRPERIGRAYISEAYDRVRSFEIQYEEGGTWKTAARGGAIGLDLELRFEEITARRVRLHITDAPGGPTIWEFLLFPPR